jgi:hypothetical protein
VDSSLKRNPDCALHDHHICKILMLMKLKISKMGQVAWNAGMSNAHMVYGFLVAD